MNLPVYVPSDNINYIGVFLTFRCNMSCPYCLNSHGKLVNRSELTANEWVTALDRIQTRDDLPVTLQGGEPTQYTGFYDLVPSLSCDLDLLTNGMFISGAFIRYVTPYKFKRDAPYASIRISYHPGQHRALSILSRASTLQSAGYQVGVWAVDHPKYSEHIRKVQSTASLMGIDFRIKEFLGTYEGVPYGTYQYPEAVYGTLGGGDCSGVPRKCLCKPSELLIGPQGYIYRCHRDLYASEGILGHILDERLPDLTVARECTNYGWCSTCDIKLKTNRLQESGHCSVEITNVEDIDHEQTDTRDTGPGHTQAT